MQRLNHLTRKELMEVVQTAQREIVRLGGKEIALPEAMAVRRKGRVFEMEKYVRRRVALHVCYLCNQENYFKVDNKSKSKSKNKNRGYFGFSRKDEESVKLGVVGIENVLMDALRKVNLIRGDDFTGSDCKWSASGRTDRGVSAFGQIVTLDIRSSALGINSDKISLPEPKDELDYPLILNKVLPDDIRILGWAPCPAPNYQARFKCDSRIYRYYFLKKKLNLGLMEQAASYFVGTHDFCNFCTIDVGNVVHFTRNIYSVLIKRAYSHSTTVRDDDVIFYFEISGTAFLYHQVRHMVAVLFHVGMGLEKPEIVKDLLDVSSKYPRRPAYVLASESPLILFQTKYNDLQFYYSPKAMKATRSRFLQQHSQDEHRAAMTRDILNGLESFPMTVHSPKSETIPYYNHAEFEQQQCEYQDKISKRKDGTYIEFSKLKTCLSLEERTPTQSTR